MPMPELTIQRRPATGKQAAKRLRRQGVVPAVLYGGARAEPVAVDPRAVLRVLHGHAGSMPLLSLRIEGEASPRLAIIRDMQFDPVSERLIHVDLQEVQADRPITVRVAVHAVGEAVGVREQKGILQLVMHEVEVECLPTRIPERLEADVTRLRIGDVLTVGELPVPEGVRILNPADQAVCTVAPPMAEEAAAPAPAVTAEPEVLTERRAKEEAGAEDEGKRERTKR